MEHLAAVIEAHPFPPALLDAMEAALRAVRKDLPRGGAFLDVVFDLS